MVTKTTNGGIDWSFSYSGQSGYYFEGFKFYRFIKRLLVPKGSGLVGDAISKTTDREITGLIII